MPGETSNRENSLTYKMSRIRNHLLYILLDGGIYGLIVYWLSTWLTEHSFLLAYFGNLALIALAISIDEYAFKYLQSKALVKQIEQNKDSEKSYRIIQWLIDSFVSFKTMLYLFYIVILIVSQIIAYNPSLLSMDAGLENFITLNSYTILLLIAFDKLIEQFSRDRGRMRKVSDTLREYLTGKKNDGS